MKNLFLTFVLLSGMAVNAQKVTLQVDIDGFQNDIGKARVGLYNSEGTFLKTTYMKLVSEIKSRKASVIFKNVPAGEYAISMYHDENDNGKLDKNFVGMPKEGYMASNNEKGFMGPPKYENAKFVVREHGKINIKLD